MTSSAILEDVTAELEHVDKGLARALDQRIPRLRQVHVDVVRGRQHEAAERLV